MKHKKDETRIEKAIRNWWGKRCPDYEEDCPICEAWKEYDDLIKEEKD